MLSKENAFNMNAFYNLIDVVAINFELVFKS